MAMVVFVAVISQWVAWALKVPSILLLLISGFALGQIIDPRAVFGVELLYAGVSIAVGVILFEGSLTLRWSEVSGLGTSVKRLCTLTVVIAWPLIFVAALISGVDARLAALIGAMLVVTGPTVINPILRQLRPTRRVSTLLRWEGIVVDPIGAVLATLVFTAIVARGNGWTQVLISLGLTLVVGFGIGLTVGWYLAWLLRIHAIPDYLQGVLFLGIAVASFVASNAIQPESGLVTVTLLGLFLGNQQDLKLERVKEFKEHLQLLFVGALFVVLAALISVDDLRHALPIAAVFIPLLILVARPISVYLGLWRSDSTMQERTLLAFMAPRGIVAAAVTSIFALELEHYAEAARVKAEQATGAEAARLAVHAQDLTGLADKASELVPLVFLVVVVTVAVYGLGVGRLAERLGLASSSPQGVLFAGGSEWVVQAAERLKELDLPVRVVTMNLDVVRKARSADVPVTYSHLLSDLVLRDLDFAGIGTVITASRDDEVNTNAAREFSHIFGTSRTFQLKRGASMVKGKAGQASEHHSARTPFSIPVSFAELDEKMAEGLTVRRTRLSKNFTREDFYKRYGTDTVVMFTLVDGKLSVVKKGDELPQTATDVIALLPPRSATANNKAVSDSKADANVAQ